MKVFYVIAAATYILSAIQRDYQTREREYTQPLATMPDNARALADEMFQEAIKDKNLTEQQAKKIEADIWKMLGEGAVLQRNHELAKTREQISYLGQLLSWFMKAKGLTYAQILAKYEKDFSEDDKALHEKIVNSASRANQDLVAKLKQSIYKKLGYAPQS